MTEADMLYDAKAEKKKTKTKTSKKKERMEAMDKKSGLKNEYPTA